MATIHACPLSLILLSFVFFSSSAVATTNTNIMHQGSSLSVEDPKDVIFSPNRIFSAGFYAVGENAYSFAVWFSEPNVSTLVWMANRDQPVNGKRSKFSLLHNGNLALNDADGTVVWSTNTVSLSSAAVHLSLENTGNLLLRETEGKRVVLWQSFDSPTDTLLPQQVFTRQSKLVSSRSETNKSSGFYTLFFDNDNILRLLYDGPNVSGLYWPDPWLAPWDAGRSSYNNTRLAFMDTLGKFSSSDEFNFMTSDYGKVLQRRLTMDHDGNIRVYSRRNQKWSITWQAKSTPCSIHGICGPNSLCNYHQNSGLKCSCLPGYKRKNDFDWSYGCEPKFHESCKRNESRFLYISNVKLFGFDYEVKENYTLRQCKELCLQLCNCKGIQYTFYDTKGTYTCYPKLQLRHASRIQYFTDDLYLRLPANSSYSNNEGSTHEHGLNCSSKTMIKLERTYDKGHENRYVRFLVWFAGGVGGLELLCVFVVWFFLVRTRGKRDSGVDGRDYALTGFRKFSYSELKEATRGFSEEIGRGGGGVVYKGVLLDERVAAVKRLKDVNQGQGEEEFLAEVSCIGRLNHMNLIEMWGYCAEGKHRLLVYEYMENGSLAQNLQSSDALDWTKRFDIALGTARCLAYIHEECLEWILHCDVKPQNILLDSHFQPKVADFGLSKLRNRNETTYSSFSTIRGTRGYMAPEWIFNQSITSKVDVYSYGIVVMEMVTGRSATLKDIDSSTDNNGVENQQLNMVAWLKEKQRKGFACVSEILDPKVEGVCDEGKMETLARVAMQCIEEEKDKRPTMSQVVEMLQKSTHENDHNR